MKLEDIKSAITECETALTVALADAERLPIMAGEQDALGNISEGDKLYEQAEKAAHLAKRLTVKLNALRKGYAEQLEIQKEIAREQTIAELRKVTDKAEKELLRRIDKLAAAFDDIIDYNVDDVRADRLSGKFFLHRFLSFHESQSGTPQHGAPYLMKDKAAEMITAIKNGVIQLYAK